MEPWFSDLFATFDTNITGFALSKAQEVTQLIAPAVYSAMSIFIMFQGYNQFFGETEKPLAEFLRSVLKVAIVGTGALNLGIYNDYFVRTFQDSPAALMSALSNNPKASTMSSATGQVLDHILNDCLTAGLSFWDVASLAHPGGFIIAPLVWAVGLVVTGYTAFLVILSKLFVSIILAIGPLFILAYLFEATKNYFATFLNNLVQYGLVGVLAMLSCESILGIFQNVAQAEAARGGALQIVDLASMFIVGFISILLLLQVQSVASGLAGGIALETFGAGQKTRRATTDGARYIAGKSYNAAKRLFRKTNEIAKTTSNKEQLRPRKEMPRRAPIRTGTSD